MTRTSGLPVEVAAAPQRDVSGFRYFQSYDGPQGHCRTGIKKVKYDSAHQLPLACIAEKASSLPRIFALPTLLHDASVEGLEGPDIVRIKLGERADFFCRDFHWSL